MVPCSSNSKYPSSVSFISPGSMMRIGTPISSIREARLTTSPYTVKSPSRFKPTLPVATIPQFTPTRTAKSVVMWLSSGISLRSMLYIWITSISSNPAYTALRALFSRYCSEPKCAIILSPSYLST